VRNRTITQIAFLPTLLMLGILARSVGPQVVSYGNTAALVASSTSSIAVTFDDFTPTDMDIQI
jgi:hypothetical protein